MRSPPSMRTLSGVKSVDSRGRSRRTNSVAGAARRAALAMVEHFEELDRIGGAVALDDVEPARVAAVELHARSPARVKFAVLRACRRAARRSAPSPAARRRRCSRPPPPARRSGATGAAAARPAPGSAWSPRAWCCWARTRARASPLPKSGRITRSPGAVNSTCSMRSRMWSPRSVLALRPRPSKWKG